MEHFEFEIEGNKKATYKRDTAIAGVVASSNLEILMEVKDMDGKCRFVIDTAAKGFEPSWRAVTRDFMELNNPGNLLVSVNDNAASPAVVSLRLSQALEELDS